MFCGYTRPRYQVSVYMTIGPLVYMLGANLGLLLYKGFSVTTPADPFFH